MNIGIPILNLLLSIIICYYLLTDGKSLVDAEWMVLLPVTLYVIYTEIQTRSSVFNTGDNCFIHRPRTELILRPHLIGKVSSIHPLLILLSSLGGGIVGEIAGFFLAPVAVGMIIAAYNVYAKTDSKSD